MPASPATPERDEDTARLLMTSARMYARRVDPLDRVEFVHMTPEGFRDSPFLDHRTQTAGGTPVWVTIDELVAMADAQGGSQSRPAACRRCLPMPRTWQTRSANPPTT